MQPLNTAESISLGLDATELNEKENPFTQGFPISLHPVPRKNPAHVQKLLKRAFKLTSGRARQRTGYSDTLPVFKQNVFFGGAVRMHQPVQCLHHIVRGNYPIHILYRSFRDSGSVQRVRRSRSIRFYQSPHAQLNASEVSCDDNKCVCKIKTRDSPEDGLPCGTSRFAVVGEVLPARILADSVRPAVMRRLLM